MVIIFAPDHTLVIPRWANRFVFFQIDPFAVLFWALGIVLVHILQQVTQPTGLASFTLRYSTAVESKVQFEEASPPYLFPSRCTYSMAPTEVCETY